MCSRPGPPRSRARRDTGSSTPIRCLSTKGISERPPQSWRVTATVAPGGVSAADTREQDGDNIVESQAHGPPEFGGGDDRVRVTGIEPGNLLAISTDGDTSAGRWTSRTSVPNHRVFATKTLRPDDRLRNHLPPPLRPPVSTAPRCCPPPQSLPMSWQIWTVIGSAHVRDCRGVSGRVLSGHRLPVLCELPSVSSIFWCCFRSFGACRLWPGLSLH